MADRMVSAMPLEFRFGLAHEVGDLTTRHDDQRHDSDADGHDHERYGNDKESHCGFTTSRISVIYAVTARRRDETKRTSHAPSSTAWRASLTGDYAENPVPR
jgi:hypothetical protein